MQYRFFQVSIGDTDAEAELNSFLRRVRVLQVERYFVSGHGFAYWAICVEYLAQGSGDLGRTRSKIDYRTVLSDGDFKIFSALREMRKTISVEESVPVYAVCTNEHLAEMARSRPTSLSAFCEIEGFGKAKAERYGIRFLEIIAQEDATR
jgi:superfamily II DNA helicase RecQ